MRLEKDEDATMSRDAGPPQTQVTEMTHSELVPMPQWSCDVGGQIVFSATGSGIAREQTFPPSDRLGPVGASWLITTNTGAHPAACNEATLTTSAHIDSVPPPPHLGNHVVECHGSVPAKAVTHKVHLPPPGTILVPHPVRTPSSAAKHHPSPHPPKAPGRVVRIPSSGGQGQPLEAHGRCWAP